MTPDPGSFDWQAMLADLRAQVADLTRKLEHPTSDEIIAGIESLEERTEKSYIYQRERAEKAEAEVERLRSLHDAHCATGCGL